MDMFALAMVPFAAGIALIALLGFLLTLYVFYDVLVQQPEMQGIEKLIWVAVVLSFNIFGVIAYLYIIRSRDDLLLEPKSERIASRRLDRLEQLNKLREDGALTEDEFKEQKKELLED